MGDMRFNLPSNNLRKLRKIRLFTDADLMFYHGIRAQEIIAARLFMDERIAQMSSQIHR